MVFEQGETQLEREMVMDDGIVFVFELLFLISPSYSYKHMPQHKCIPFL